MSVNFRFCGKIRNYKESDSFSPLNVTKFESGWSLKTLKFQGINGSNKHCFQVKASYWANPDGSINADKMEIFTVFDDGKERVNQRIAYKDRTDPEIVKQVSGFKKYVMDLNDPDADRIPERRKEYIFEGDFINAITNLLSHEELADKKYRISGTVEMQYSDQTKTYYRQYSVQKISFAKPDAKEEMVLGGGFIYGPDSWNEEDEGGLVTVNVWCPYYDSAYRKDSCRGRACAPFSFLIKDEWLPGENKEDVKKVLKKRLTSIPEDAEYGFVKIEADVIDGAQREEISLSDLPDDVQEDIALGVTTLDAEIRKHGGTGYGPKVQQYRLRRAYATEASAYTDENVLYAPVHDGANEKGSSKKSSKSSANVEDLLDEI